MGVVAALFRAGCKARQDIAPSWLDWRGKAHDRSKHVSASEIGACARKIKFGKLTPSSQKLDAYGFAERGHAVEAWAVEQLRHAGVSLLAVGEDQRTVHDQYQSGTPDGIIRLPDQDLLWDCKSIDPRATTSRLPKEQHVLQVIQNIDLANHCYDLQICEGALTYIDASNFELVHEFKVEFDHAVADALQERARTIMGADSPEALPAEGLATGECPTCRFKDRCSGAVQQARQARKQQEKHSNVAATLFK